MCADTGKRRRVEGPFYNVVCSNVSHLATDAKFSPGAKPNNGLVHLNVMKACNRLTALRTFINAEDGGHLQMDHVRNYRATEVTIVPANVDDGGCMAVDGDLAPYGAVHVAVNPGQARLVCGGATPLPVRK
jgi:diacylglycerol kinase family enzyme